MVNDKQNELLFYQKLYQQGKSTSVGPLRRVLLNKSEVLFRDRLCRLAQGRRVLEIGCGDGAILLGVAKIAESAVGIDFSPEAIDRAKAAAAQAGLGPDRAKFLVMDAEKLEFDSHSFDLVVDHEVFSSIRIELVLNEICRVLKKDGVLLGKETFGHNFVLNLLRSISVLVGRRTSCAASRIVQDKELRQMADRFNVGSVEYFHFMSLLAAPLVKLPFDRLTAKVVSRLDRLDSLLFNMEIFRRMAFKVVFEYSSPK